jgi:hypothetical protein
MQEWEVDLWVVRMTKASSAEECKAKEGTMCRMSKVGLEVEMGGVLVRDDGVDGVLRQKGTVKVMMWKDREARNGSLDGPMMSRKFLCLVKFSFRISSRSLLAELT